MKTTQRTPLAGYNKSAKFFQRHAEKSRVRILHAFHKIKKYISVLLGIAHNMGLGESHRIAASARNDVVQVLDQ